ncbi:hypothetical protein NESM_000827000 [Novymonas esmeraldas]|uniref:Uncharacterized protein n=1 Tax=Novymonas esmeraldas TaxID=1808958 RepID=A0AAW0EZA2_9TRYP
MDVWHVLSLKVDLRDYPEYATCVGATEHPGLALCEYYAFSGMRYTVPLGYAASVAYFYLYRRPRLSFADRALEKLHHYFYPSAAYTAPLGIVGGVLYGTTDCVRGLSPAALDAVAAREKAAAAMAASHYNQRRRAATAQLEATQSLASKVLVGLRLRDDPVRAELLRMGLGEDSVTWESLLVPHGYLWTKQNSLVHDVARYRSDNCAGVDVAVAARASPSPACGSPSTSAGAAAGGAGAAAAEAHLTKAQVDAVVSRLATLRVSADEHRWVRTTGRCGFYGVVGMLLTWNSGGALFRAQMGLGLGVVVGSAVSATRLDQMFTYM